MQLLMMYHAQQTAQQIPPLQIQRFTELSYGKAHRAISYMSDYLLLPTGQRAMWFVPATQDAAANGGSSLHQKRVSHCHHDLTPAVWILNKAKEKPAAPL